MTDGSRLAGLELRGGDVCLDFANTVGWRGRGANDYLADFADLVGWGLRAGVVGSAVSEALLLLGEADAGGAERVFRRAIELREAIYGIFSALAAAEGVDRTELALLEREVRDAMSQARLRPEEGGFAWDWEGVEVLERIVWPIARAAAELLVSPEVARVGECAGEGCGWLYLDTSRNRSRRWCDMRDCGNREKVRRHYQRKRRREAPAE
jgi:predicted RNA-binding Zn ribbon-like protein